VLIELLVDFPEVMACGFERSVVACCYRIPMVDNRQEDLAAAARTLRDTA
jgi:hypothetical protein